MQNAPDYSGAFVALETVPVVVINLNGRSRFQGKQAAEQNACLGACAMALGAQLSPGFNAGVGVLDDALGETGLNECVGPVAGLDVSIGECCRVVPAL